MVRSVKRKLGGIGVALVIVALSSCGTFGSYTIPPEAIEAAELDRTLDRALDGVSYGPFPVAFGNAAVVDCAAELGGQVAPAKASTPGGDDEQGSPEPPRRGIATKGSPYREVLSVGSEEAPARALVTMSPPTVVTALQGLLALVDSGEGAVELTASRTLAVAAAARYLSRTGQLSEPSRVRIAAWLCADTRSLVAAQDDEGGWSGGGSTSTTSYVLAALIEARALGADVPVASLRRASELLFTGSETSTAAAAQGVDVDSAQAFAVLAALPADARGAGYAPTMASLEERLTAALDEQDVVATVAAYTVLGLARRGDQLAARGRLSSAWQAARRLWQRRHEEPSWSREGFEDLGSEAAFDAIALEALRELDPEWFEMARREALRELLGDREPDGTWGGHRRTAAAIRALLLVDPVPAEPRRAGALTVRLDQHVVRRVALDLDDSLDSATELRDVPIELAPDPAAHVLEVSVDGDLAVQVVVRRAPRSSTTE